MPLALNTLVVAPHTSACCNESKQPCSLYGLSPCLLVWWASLHHGWGGDATSIVPGGWQRSVSQRLSAELGSPKVTFIPRFKVAPTPSLHLVHAVQGQQGLAHQGLPDFLGGEPSGCWGKVQRGSSAPERLQRWEWSPGADGHEAALPSAAGPGRVEMAA